MTFPKTAIHAQNQSTEETSQPTDPLPRTHGSTVVPSPRWLKHAKSQKTIT